MSQEITQRPLAFGVGAACIVQYVVEISIPAWLSC